MPLSAAVCALVVYCINKKCSAHTLWVGVCVCVYVLDVHMCVHEKKKS